MSNMFDWVSFSKNNERVFRRHRAEGRNRKKLWHEKLTSLQTFDLAREARLNTSCACARVYVELCRTSTENS